MVMDFTFLVVNFLFFSCLVLPDFLVGAADQIGAGKLPDLGSIPGIAAGAGIAGADVMPCMQTLLPCKPHLKSPSPPPPSCCGPLKDMVTKDTQCLCKVFNNPEVLKSLNVSQDEALKLPKACGADADMSTCNATSPASSTANSTAASVSSSNDSASGPPPKSAGNRIPQVQFAEFGLISLLVTLGFFTA